MFLTPACCHLSVVLSFQNTQPCKYKDVFLEVSGKGLWRGAQLEGAVTTMTVMEAADAQKFLLMGSRDQDRY